MLTIGIDPGLTGAVGVLENGNYYGLYDMPTVSKGSGSVKNEVDPAGLASILLEFDDARMWLGLAAATCVIERVNAMPKQGSSSTFSLGDSFGCARAVVASIGIGLTYVSPVTWKKHFKLPSDKEASRALAVRLYPSAPLNLKKHADRAEALLMARWLYETQAKG
jgi:crossover junction endodeoxyribonuclease RuvC